MSQIKAGAFLAYINIIISILIALIYTPIMIRIIGQAEFGLYSLIGSLAAYFSVMDMGLGNAMVRYTSRNRVLGDLNQEAKLNGLFLFFYSIIGIITVIVGIIVYENLNQIFSGTLTATELASAKIMVIILIINFSLSFPLSIFNSILKAYEKFVVEKLISIVRILLAPLLILPIIYIGYGAISMVVITTIVNLGCLTFSAIYCFKKLEIRISFGKVDEYLVKEIIIYSFFVFLAVIVDQIYWQTDQIILGAISGTISVAVYAIAIQFIKLYIQFSTSISGLFLPRASMMVAKNASNEELTNMMVKYGRIQYLVLTLIFCGFLLYGELFIVFWAGNQYIDAYKIVLIIMAPLTLPLVQNLGISILYAKNKQVFRSIVLIFIALINVLISIPVAKSYGYIGVSVVTAVTLFIGNVLIMNVYYHKSIGINIHAFWKNIFWITLPLLIPLSIGYLINLIPIPNDVFYLFVKIMLYTLIHCITLYFLVINKYEKDLISSLVFIVLKKFKG